MVRRSSQTSLDAKDLVTQAETWLQSSHGLAHLVGVMAGVVRTRRHRLFLEKSQREGCSGRRVSKLHWLSNPGYLEARGVRDTRILRYLETKVFLPNLARAQQELQEVAGGRQIPFLYCSCVLLPETMIHLLEEQGMNRLEAERVFQKVEEDAQEKRGLRQEIQEAARRWQKQQEVEEEWVDHSDMSDSEENDLSPIRKIKLKRVGLHWQKVRSK